MSFRKLVINILLVSLYTSGVAFADDNQYTPESQKLLEQLQTNIKGTLLAISKSEANAGKEIGNFHYTLELPSSMNTNLGLVLDLSNYQDGYEIISISPGSTAEQLPLAVGDKLISINNKKLDKYDSESAINQLVQVTPGENLSLTIASNEEVRTVSTKIEGQFIPSIKLEIGGATLKTAVTEKHTDREDLNQKSDDEQCGRVSVFFRPPEAKSIYPASISKIDEDSRKRNRNTFRLPVGKHIVYLHEYINDPIFPIRRTGIQRPKPIEIDVEANKTYYLGASFIRSKRFTTFKDKYWEPVIWRVREQKCTL